MNKLFALIIGIFTFMDGTWGQVTFNKDIAPIIFNHCMSCHRPGEIGPMSLTNYEEVKNWAGTIRYVTEQRIMPPWKADHNFSRFLGENYLNDDQIKKIGTWIDGGLQEGLASDLPQAPIFPTNSLLGTPDLVLTFKKSYTHKGNGKDEYRYFVLPSGLIQNKKIKALELRPGNNKIVHHALFFADQSGKARQYDAQTPEYGFSADDFADFNADEVINRDQFPGYVPGQKSRYFPDGLAQDLPANSDIVVQMHYAPWSVDEKDSSTVNIFFAKSNEVIERTVKGKIMLPFDLVGGASSFFLTPNQVKKFTGVYTVPFDVSLIGLSPHMHYLGKNWEVVLENTDGTKTNLIRINDWDFNWQGDYYFNKYIRAKKGSKIRAVATYDNTANNPANPTIPPKFVTWGEGTKDEMYYLPIFYVPYKAGDENIVFNETNTSVSDVKSKYISGKIFPNPVNRNQASWTQISFNLTSGFPVKIDLVDAAGTVVRNLRDQEYFGQGDHMIHLETQQLTQGAYFVKISGNQDQLVIPLMVLE
jgi:hypothetical protein